MRLILGRAAALIFLRNPALESKRLELTLDTAGVTATALQPGARAKAV